MYITWECRRILFWFVEFDAAVVEPPLPAWLLATTVLAFRTTVQYRYDKQKLVPANSRYGSKIVSYCRRTLRGKGRPWCGWLGHRWVCYSCYCVSKVRSFGQWAAANCAAPPTARLVPVSRPLGMCVLLLEFPCNWRSVYVRTFIMLPYQNIAIHERIRYHWRSVFNITPLHSTYLLNNVRHLTRHRNNCGQRHGATASIRKIFQHHARNA